MSKTKGSKRGLYLVLAIAGLWLAVRYMGQELRTLPSMSAESAAGDRDKDAVRVLCQGAIRASLKAPDTARLPHISKARDIGRAAEDPAILRVMTHADSANSLGVMVRTNFQCDCREIAGVWTVVNFGAIE